MNVPDIEQIWANCFKLLKTAKLGANPAFTTTSRKLVDWSTCPSQPALYLYQMPFDVSEQQAWGSAKWTLYGRIYIYAKNAPNSDNIPATQLNNLIVATAKTLIGQTLDAGGNVTPQPPDYRQNLGLPGVVEHCYLQGNVIFDDGSLDQQAIAVLPVTIVSV